MITLNPAYSSCSYQQNFQGKNVPKLNFKLGGVIDLKNLETIGLTTEKNFSPQEISVLKSSEISETHAIWRGTTLKDHTIYRGKFIRFEYETERPQEFKFYQDLFGLKKGDIFSFAKSDCYPTTMFGAYDHRVAMKYASIHEPTNNFIKDRILFEIDVPRDSHMYLSIGEHHEVALPVNNTYELVQDPTIVQQKVLTYYNTLEDAKFLYTKLRLLKEDLSV